jgi:predicted TIM-barrel fold metal-dependent hydrolase
MSICKSIVVVVLLALTTASIVAQEAPPVADHHMHMRSEAMAKAIKRAAEKVNEPIPPGPPSSQGAAEVLAALDSAGVARAAVLSTAYLFGMPDMGFENEQASVVAENDYVSREVANHRDRLVGFCSVNPLAEYAMSEVTRCSTLPGMVGIKLHFANSDVDLRKPAHVDRLKAIFREAQRSNRPLIIHMHTRHPDYGAHDARIFIREVLPEAPTVTAQIAHMAGGGGSYHDGADQALGVFLQAFADGALRGKRILFDLAGVVNPPPEGTDNARAMRQSHARLAERIRQIGADRVVFASDWGASSVTATIVNLRKWLPLKPDELRVIMNNKADYLFARKRASAPVRRIDGVNPNSYSRWR